MAKSLAGKKLVNEVVKLALSKKAEDITLFNLGKKSPLADWIVLCSADNPVHGRAIAGEILYGLRAKETRAFHNEGVEDGRWALLDYTDVIVHVMSTEVREYYEVDQLWAEMGVRTSPDSVEPDKEPVPPKKKPRKKPVKQPV